MSASLNFHPTEQPVEIKMETVDIQCAAVLRVSAGSFPDRAEFCVFCEAADLERIKRAAAAFNAAMQEAAPVLEAAQ